jgi:hypothetical protein
MNSKNFIFLECECMDCNEVVAYKKVEDGTPAAIVTGETMDLYCKSCHDKHQQETEGMT